jgi:hypothetical protein
MQFVLFHKNLYVYYFIMTSLVATVFCKFYRNWGAGKSGSVETMEFIFFRSFHPPAEPPSGIHLFRQSACLTCQIRCLASWVASFRLFRFPSNSCFFFLFPFLYKIACLTLFSLLHFYFPLFSRYLSQNSALFPMEIFLSYRSISRSYKQISSASRRTSLCLGITKSTELRQKNCRVKSIYLEPRTLC